MVLGLVAVAIAWGLAQPFWELSGQFGSFPVRQPSRLYGQPFEIRHGDRLAPDTLVSQLEAAGYAARDGEPTPGTFHRQGDRLVIFRRVFSTARGQAGGDRLEVRFEGHRVAGLRRLDGIGPALASAFLDPPLIASFYGPDLRERRPIRLDELPEELILSVLAAEDSSFLEHKGVSITGILRAAWVNLRSQGVRQGGSTLTQQLVKNRYLTHERAYRRKAQEAALAVLLELRHEKRAILQAYLNEIYWGRSGAVNLMGVGAASWAYFRKHPSELDLAESALLAGMIQSPTHLSPVDHPEAARERRDFVLGRLAQLRWVERTRLDAAAQSPVTVHRNPLVARQAPFFADAAEDEARRRFGLDDLTDAGYVLHSTLSLADQRQAEEALIWGVEALEKGWEKESKTQSTLEAALVSLDPSSGGVLAWVGGRDYSRSQFDRVTLARRQAGSAFKPIVFAAAFERRVATPATFLDDSPYTVRLAGKTWSPGNSDGQYRGWVSARTVLEKSLNVPTARLASERLGLEPVVELAKKMGIESRLDPLPALALGAMEVTPLELATVYATLAAGGERPSPHTLVAIFDRQGQPVEGSAVPAPVPALSPESAFLVNKILEGVLDRGTARKAREQGLTDTLAGKTGTTNSRRDSWFAGYSPERASLVWVGYDDNSKTRLSGARAALPIWARFTLGVRPPEGYRAFEQPPGVVEARIDPETGGLATDRCPAVVGEYFRRDFLPGELCPRHGGFRARPLDQPEGIEPPEKEHPFRRWLDIVRGRKKDARVD